MTPQSFIAWRKRLGLSQAKAAEALGMGKRQIQKYEAGTPIPLTVRLAMSAIAHGIPPMGDVAAVEPKGRQA